VALVAFDNGTFKGDRPKLRYLQADLPGFGFQISFIRARSGINPLRAALVAACLAQLVSFGVQELIQGFL
jgi:hypothetical protein